VVGEKIRNARKRVGLSQRELSRIANVRQCQISDLERNKLKLDHVHFGTIVKLSDALDMQLDDFRE
jgi:transcriptional regulator with XRE-family HTH domain